MNKNTQHKQLKIEFDNLKHEVANYKKLFHKSNSELSQEITDNVTTKLDLKNKNELLQNKIKELNCLNEISRCEDIKKLNLDKFLLKVVSIIASAFRYPEYVSVEIKYKERLWQSDNFVKSNLILNHVLNCKNNIIGKISIFNNDKIEDKNTRPFLNEEKHLLGSIANSLEHIIDRITTDNRLKMLQTAINQSNLMISFTNIRTRKIEYINPMFYKVFGMERGDVLRDKLYYNTPDEKLFHDQKDRLKHITNKKIWHKTFKNETKDGKPFWQKTALYPFVENSIVTHSLGISEDINNEVRDAEELKLAEEKYEHITQNVPEAILIINRKGSLLYANNMASELTAYSHTELLKLNVIDLLYSDDYNKEKLRLSKIIEGYKLESRYEIRVKTKNDETKFVEVSGSKSKWMGEVVDLAVFVDVTKKKRFENLLKIQDEIDYLSSIPEGLNVSLNKIFASLLKFEWIDGGGIYLNFNEGLKLVFSKGLSNKSVTKAKFLLIGSEQFNILMRSKTQYFIFDKPQTNLLYLIDEGINSVLLIQLTHDDEIIGVLTLVSNNKIELSENEKMIFEAIAARISQTITLIKVQNELKNKNKKLQQTIKDVQEKQQLLIQKSKLESLGEMSSGIAHEINQPLGIIFLSLENILFKISKKDVTQEYLNKKLNSINSNIKKIKEITDHIRTFTIYQKSIILEKFDVNNVIKKAYSIIKEQYIYHNIIINFDMNEDIWYALGNSYKFEQVMFNLFSNAKYALEDKEESSGEDTFDKEIQVRTYSDENKIYIEVKDCGTGIEKENLDNIFNPFFTTKPVGKGTGLGLSIVYGIITEMKGSISIDSVRNEYTKVSIELPKTK